VQTGRFVDADALVVALADLTRVATENLSVESMLRQLCMATAETLPVDAAGIMAVWDDVTRYVHASSTDLTPVERLQEELQDGPCQEAQLQRAPVVVTDMAACARWPDFTALALQLDLQSMLAVPLIGRGRCWGVLDVFRRSAGPWDAADLHAVHVMADLAVSYIVMAVDRDAAWAAQTELTRRAMHDDLTGLPNRALMLDRLEHALSAADRRQTAVAVLFIDIDRFKAINDTFGHTAGDAVLTEVARRLADTIRGNDTVARFAGDEFVLICEDLPRGSPEALRQRVAAVTGRIHGALRHPISLGRFDTQISASIGVSLSTDVHTVQGILAEADSAMFGAKRQGRGRVLVRDHNEGGSAGYAGKVERDLATALERAEMLVYYQPIVAVDGGGLRNAAPPRLMGIGGDGHRVAAVEALLRWRQSPDLVLPAAAFINIAVRCGLIHSLGRWLIEETCGQLNTWREQLGERAPGTVFVNLSAQELADATLPETLDAALDRYGLAPECLGLEIVEEDLQAPGVLPRLAGYHDRGHPLAIDDFGTGYSSLSRLLNLPVDLVKIDRSFLQDVPHDRRRAGLIDAILGVAASLELQVIAEGVETQAQCAHLTAAGCQLLQGYYLGYPQPATELTMTLSDGQPSAPHAGRWASAEPV
jgi:diguanylate cyclase (GGDEF)-like protein